jgi:hypothetical protein
MKLIKLILVLVLGSIVILFAGGYYRNMPQQVMRSINIGSSSRQITFVLEYAGFIPVGSARIQNQGVSNIDGKPILRITSLFSTNGIIDMFFKLRAEATSIIDDSSLCPLEFTYSYMANGKLKDEKKVLYDQENHVMQTLKEKRVIQPETRDPMCLIAYLDRQTLMVGQTIDLNINTNQKNYRFLARVLEKKMYKTSGVDAQVFVINGSVKRSDKTSGHSTDFSLWYMDKPVKCPVLIKAMTGAGVVVSRASEVK